MIEAIDALEKLNKNEAKQLVDGLESKDALRRLDGIINPKEPLWSEMFRGSDEK